MSTEERKQAWDIRKDVIRDLLSQLDNIGSSSSSSSSSISAIEVKLKELEGITLEEDKDKIFVEFISSIIKAIAVLGLEVKGLKEIIKERG